MLAAPIGAESKSLKHVAGVIRKSWHIRRVRLMHISNSVQRVWKVISLIFFAAFITFIAYDYLVNSPKAELAQKELEEEFKAITPLPCAAPQSHHAFHKSSIANAGSTYFTKLPFSEIRKYYDEELARRGWKFHREEEVREWGEFRGGRIVYYCKGVYKAALQYAGGDRPDFGWIFALDLSWRLETLYPCGSDYR